MDSYVNINRSLTRNPFLAVFQHHLNGSIEDGTIDSRGGPFNDTLIPMRNLRGSMGWFIIVSCNISVYDITVRYHAGNTECAANVAANVAATRKATTMRIRCRQPWRLATADGAGAYEPWLVFTTRLLA